MGQISLVPSGGGQCHDPYSTHFLNFSLFWGVLPFLSTLLPNWRLSEASKKPKRSQNRRSLGGLRRLSKGWRGPRGLQKVSDQEEADKNGESDMGAGFWSWPQAEQTPGSLLPGAERFGNRYSTHPRAQEKTPTPFEAGFQSLCRFNFSVLIGNVKTVLHNSHFVTFRLWCILMITLKKITCWHNQETDGDKNQKETSFEFHVPITTFDLQATSFIHEFGTWSCSMQRFVIISRYIMYTVHHICLFVFCTCVWYPTHHLWKDF